MNKNTYMSKFEKKIYIYIAITYLVLTIFLFAFGPIDYDIRHPFILFSYLLFSVFLLYLGFVMSVNMKKNSKMQNKRLRLNPLRIFKITTFIYIIIVPLTLYGRTGSFFIDFSNFENLGQAYLDRYYNVQAQGRSYIEWIRIILSPLLVTYIPLGFIHWKNISKKYKLIFIFNVFFSISIDVITGTNKALADFLIISFIMILIKIIRIIRSDSLEKRKSQKIKKKFYRTAFLFSIFMVFFLMFFSSVMTSRKGGIDLNRPNVNYENPFVVIMPTDGLKQGFVDFTSYLTQGYHAVDISFDKEFQSTFGFGSSMYLLDSTREWFNTDFFINRSYIYKNDLYDGWDSKQSWSSLYVWIANDYSFFGVLIILFIIGRILGATWRKVITNYDIESLIVLSILTQLVFYIPANNQVFQIPEALFSSIFWIILWVANSMTIQKRG